MLEKHVKFEIIFKYEGKKLMIYRNIWRNCLRIVFLSS